MPVWMTTPVEEQPSLTLERWRVIQMTEGGRHFVGWCLENKEGRVSSPIAEFDPENLRGVTSTGRVYQLKGPPGLDGDAEYVRDRWLAIYGNPRWTDVTADVAVPTTRQNSTATSTQAASHGDIGDADDPVQHIAAQTGLSVGVVKTFAAISDPRNAHFFTREAAHKAFTHVSAEAGPNRKKHLVLSRAWIAEGVKFKPVHLAETRQLLITVTAGTQVRSISVPEQTRRRRVMELYLESKK